MNGRSRWCVALMAVLCCVAAQVRSEVGGGLTQELAGTTLTYHYEGGRRYEVRFLAETIEWKRLDVPSRDWETGTPYIARRIKENLYYVNWHRPERVEYITILFDFGSRVMYTSALLEGKERHFESANIVELKRN